MLVVRVQQNNKKAAWTENGTDWVGFGLKGNKTPDFLQKEHQQRQMGTPAGQDIITYIITKIKADIT